MKAFLNSIGFLTIIRIPSRFCYRDGFSPALPYFPLTGLLIGAVMALVFWLTSLVLPILVSAILAIGIEVILTGGLHYDGIADVSDGIFSGQRDPDAILAIMKKSDIGSFGVIAIVFALLLKVSLVLGLFTMRGATIMPALLALCFMPAAGRWSMVYLLAYYKPAKKQGSLAAMFYSGKNKVWFAISTIYLFILFAGLSYIFQILWGRYHASYGKGIYLVLIGLVPVLQSIFIFMGAFLIMLLSGHFLSKRLNGINGDILGATSVIVEIFYLFITLILLGLL